MSFISKLINKALYSNDIEKLYITVEFANAVLLLE